MPPPPPCHVPSRSRALRAAGGTAAPTPSRWCARCDGQPDGTTLARAMARAFAAFDAATGRDTSAPAEREARELAGLAAYLRAALDGATVQR